MANKSILIIAGIAAVVGILSVYAMVSIGIKDVNNGIAVNEDKRGKGTVDTLEFKNPVTIRLIDEDGNVASETVVYNDITDEGKAYIYNVLGNSSTTVKILNKMRFVDSNGNSTPNQVFKGPDNNTVSVQAAEVDCSTQTTTNYVKCTGTFNFSSPYTTSSGGNFQTNKEIQLGNLSGSSFTKYFKLNSSQDAGTVSPGTIYIAAEITWTITVN